MNEAKNEENINIDELKIECLAEKENQPNLRSVKIISQYFHVCNQDSHVHRTSLINNNRN